MPTHSALRESCPWAAFVKKEKKDKNTTFQKRTDTLSIWMQFDTAIFYMYKPCNLQLPIYSREFNLWWKERSESVNMNVHYWFILNLRCSKQFNKFRIWQFMWAGLTLWNFAFGHAMISSATIFKLNLCKNLHRSFACKNGKATVSK